MTEDSGATPTPCVLDVSVLVAIARADAEVTRLVITLDGRGQPLVVPVLAITAASLDTRTEDGDVALLGLERLENTIIAPLRDAEQAASLAVVIVKTGWRRTTLTSPPSPMRRSARSSRWTRRNGVNTPRPSTSRCTSSRSPSRVRARDARRPHRGVPLQRVRISAGTRSRPGCAGAAAPSRCAR